MMRINPYLGFNGDCRDAMTFYQKCFGGELSFQTFGESPMASQCPAGQEGQILHSALIHNEFILMATDMKPPSGFQPGSDMSLAVNFDSETEIRRIYELLKTEGLVIDDLKPTFWGSLFGVVKDRFGKVWMLDCEVEGNSK